MIKWSVHFLHFETHGLLWSWWLHSLSAHTQSWQTVTDYLCDPLLPTCPLQKSLVWFLLSNRDECVSVSTCFSIMALGEVNTLRVQLSGRAFLTTLSWYMRSIWDTDMGDKRGVSFAQTCLHLYYVYRNVYLNYTHAICLALFPLNITVIHLLSPFTFCLADNYPWPQRCLSKNSTMKEGKIKLFWSWHPQIKIITRGKKGFWWVPRHFQP